MIAVSLEKCYAFAVQQIGATDYSDHGMCKLARFLPQIILNFVTIPHSGSL